MAHTMADARTLRCPGCGAAADPDAGRCGYCRARLATVSCPSCFARIFDGAAFCPACGARRTRTETGGEGTSCPGCQSVMTLVEVGETPILECRGCDAAWVDRDVFEALCASREARAAVLPSLHAATPNRALPKVQYRKCLRCGSMMNRVNFGRLSGTIVDTCRGHGVFLDAGELHAIVTFIQGGGLDRARARELEEIREERRRLEQARASAAYSQPTPGEWQMSSSATWDASSILDLLDRLRR